MSDQADLSIVTPTYPPRIGGPASHLPGLVRHLGRRLSLRVVAPDGSIFEEDGRTSFHTFRREYRIRYLDVIRNETILAGVIRREIGLARTVYLHGAAINHGLASLASLPPGRVIQKYTGHQPWEYMMTQRKDHEVSLDRFCRRTPRELLGRHGAWVALTDGLVRRSLGRSDLVVVPGPWLGEIVRTLGVSPERIRVIYNPVPSADLCRGFRPLGGAEPCRLMTAGRLVAHKGLEELVEWIGGRNDFTLTVIGGGPLEARLRARIAEREWRNVRLLGVISRAALREHLRRETDLFLLNSRYEGFSHLLIEAAATGVRFVATDIPGNRDVTRLLGAAVGALFTMSDEADFWRKVDEGLSFSPEPASLEEVKRIMDDVLSEESAFRRLFEIIVQGNN